MQDRKQDWPGRRGRILPLLAALVVTGSMMAGGASGAWAGHRQDIRVVGSSSMYRITARAAESFGHAGYGKTPVVVESTGTGGGMKQFCAGISAETPDIAMASRRMTAGEQELCRQNDVRDVVELPVGSGGMVVINASRGPEFRFLRRHLWLAVAAMVPHRGTMVPNFYTRWQEIDAALPDEPILVYGPPLTSGTRDALTGMVMEPECLQAAGLASVPEAQWRETCLKVREDGLYVEAGESDDALLRRVEANPQSVGIIGFHALLDDPAIKAASIDAVPPTVATIMSGIYPLVRNLYLYVKGDHMAQNPDLADFVRYYTSEEMIGPAGSLSGNGLVPLPAEEREETQERAASLKGKGRTLPAGKR